MLLMIYGFGCEDDAVCKSVPNIHPTSCQSKSLKLAITKEYADYLPSNQKREGDLPFPFSVKKMSNNCLTQVAVALEQAQSFQAKGVWKQGFIDATVRAWDIPSSAGAIGFQWTSSRAAIAIHAGSTSFFLLDDQIMNRTVLNLRQKIVSQYVRDGFFKKHLTLR